jgi:hypothetical protein
MGEIMNKQDALITQPVEPEYELLVNNISTLWQEAKKQCRTFSKY